MYLFISISFSFVFSLFRSFSNFSPLTSAMWKMLSMLPSGERTSAWGESRCVKGVKSFENKCWVDEGVERTKRRKNLSSSFFLLLFSLPFSRPGPGP